MNPCHAPSRTTHATPAVARFDAAGARPRRYRGVRDARGGMLLEVVFALALLAASAGVIMGGLSASVRAARRVQAEASLADVSVTLLSRLQMGLLPLEDASEQAFEDPRLEGWSYSIKATAIDTGSGVSDLKHVEVTVYAPEKTASFRSASLIRPPATASPGGAAAAAIGGGM